VPNLKHFVVHAHISPTNVVATDGGVNLKWDHHEIGQKASAIPEDIAKTLIDVPVARDHWENNPNHDQAELDAEEFATGAAIAALFGPDQAEIDAQKAKAEADKAAAKAAAKAQKDEESMLKAWGWKNTNNIDKYRKVLMSAEQKRKDGDEGKFNNLMQHIREAKAKAEAKADATAGGGGG
jgi:hypothetical protein